MVSGPDYAAIEDLLRAFHRKHPDLQREVQELASGSGGAAAAAERALELAMAEGELTVEAAVWIGVSYLLPWAAPAAPVEDEDDLRFD